MYRCNICQAVSRPNQALIRHIIYRDVHTLLLTKSGGQEKFTQRQIQKEIAVCEQCSKLLVSGVSLSDLVNPHRKKAFQLREIPPAPPINQPITLGRQKG